jgi:hypothetical protein
MTTKQILSVLGVLAVLALIFGVWSSYTKPATSQEPMAGDTSPVLKGRLETDQNYHYKETAPGYEIKAVYPSKVPLPSTEASAKAALTIENKLAESIAAFKADAAQMLTAEEIARLQQVGAAYALGFDYTDYAQEGYHSYVYQVYQDTGGAHPNGFYLTFVFDLEGNAVALDQLFAPGSNYLDKLSAKAYAKVATELGLRTGTVPTPDMLDTVRIGTAPSPETLQFFYLYQDNLHLLFPPYQVASYAAGSFDIAIPLSELSDVLKR